MGEMGNIKNKIAKKIRKNNIDFYRNKFQNSKKTHTEFKATTYSILIVLFMPVVMCITSVYLFHAVTYEHDKAQVNNVLEHYTTYARHGKNRHTKADVSFESRKDNFKIFESSFIDFDGYLDEGDTVWIEWSPGKKDTIRQQDLGADFAYFIVLVGAGGMLIFPIDYILNRNIYVALKN